MEGNIPDLKLTNEICKKYDCHLIIDDCHGVGVLGDTGRGALEYWGMKMSEICLYTATLAKGLGGGNGGYVCGKYEIIRYLNQRS
jgi:glycine C-acetyltransferase